VWDSSSKRSVNIQLILKLYSALNYILYLYYKKTKKREVMTMKKPFAKKMMIGTMALALIGGGGILAISQNASAAVAASPAPQATIQQQGAHFQGMVGRASDELLAFLKLDKTAFEAKLKSGETLAQIATDQSISRDALKAELITEENTKLEKEKTDFAANIDKTVDAVQPIHPDGSGGGRHGGPQVDMSGIAKLFGLSDADLKTALTPDKSIADLATAKGITVQSVIDLQVSAIVKSLDLDLANGKITQAQYDKQKADSTNIATKIVNDKHDGTREFGGRGGRDHGPDNHGPDSRVPSNDAAQLPTPEPAVN
jgi:hypothetical protein